MNSSHSHSDVNLLKQELPLPTIIVNFKAYASAVHDKAVALAKICEEVANETGASIAIAVNALDLKEVIEAVSIPVFAQHTDSCGFGSRTGQIVPEQLKMIGCFGTLLNHAERPLSDEVLMDSIYCAKRAGLYTIVCANNPAKGEHYIKCDPDLIAVEPPDLIGGDVSVCDTDPEVIDDAVSRIGIGKVLIGAGVKDKEDVSVALQRGASGVLLASGVTKAEDPKAVLLNLVAGLSVQNK
jgi:triosephosphate isomerase